MGAWVRAVFTVFTCDVCGRCRVWRRDGFGRGRGTGVFGDVAIGAMILCMWLATVMNLCTAWTVWYGSMVEGYICVDWKVLSRGFVCF